MKIDKKNIIAVCYDLEMQDILKGFRFSDTFINLAVDTIDQFNQDNGANNEIYIFLNFFVMDKIIKGLAVDGVNPLYNIEEYEKIGGFKSSELVYSDDFQALAIETFNALKDDNLRRFKSQSDIFLMVLFWVMLSISILRAEPTNPIAVKLLNDFIGD